MPPEMYEQVQRVKEEEGRDMSELVREALRLYMEDRELRREQRRKRLRSRQAEPGDNDRGEINE
ncbi:MAG: ribbon-helix-helix protein, CopG family [Chloroflexota bacterium]|nr:ribbon-helix-helix protein, CopG family [Chloroflexota bacterium]